MFNEKTLSENRVYTGKLIKVHVDEVQLIDGRVSVREVCEHPGGVAALPITESGNAVLVRQFRYPYRSELWEVPAGKVESGEDTLECAVRELREETGYTAKEMLYAGCLYPSPGYLNEKIYLYIARGLTKGETALDDDELLRSEEFPLKTVFNMVMNDEIHDAKTIALVMKAHYMITCD